MKLKRNIIYFDEGFDFQFYEMGFCRSIMANKFILGTSEICETHESGGKFFRVLI